eukprot:6197326-Pleurochrysis_carterae.AAC.1
MERAMKLHEQTDATVFDLTALCSSDDPRLSNSHGDRSQESGNRAGLLSGYPFYAMDARMFIRLYGDGKRKLDPHQKLLHDGHLTRLDEVAAAMHTIFISHEWAGFNHPDPQRVQSLVLANALRRWLKGDASHLGRAVGDAFAARKRPASLQRLSCKDALWIWLGDSPPARKRPKLTAHSHRLVHICLPRLAAYFAPLPVLRDAQITFVSRKSASIRRLARPSRQRFIWKAAIIGLPAAATLLPPPPPTTMRVAKDRVSRQSLPR